MLQPIRDAADLPKVGATHEGSSLDFKQQVDPEQRRELAKDVAAFANATGGTILIGALEDGSRLTGYRPLAADFASRIRRGYDEAVRDFCRPAPLFDVASIEKEEGVLLAVNVRPFPAQPIGVRVGSNPSDGFFFPVRSGSQSIYLTPDQLPMFMLPELRRVAILLSGIPLGERNLVRLHSVRNNSTMTHNNVGLSFNEEQLLMRDTVEFSIGPNHFTIPASTITHVWQSGPAIWNIRTYLTIDTSTSPIEIRFPTNLL